MRASGPTLLANRYELHEVVGRGGCGMVFRATDRKLAHPVAVKMLSGGARQDASLVERLVREQQALQALTGTHAVGAVDLCRAPNGSLCLVMEWLDGCDLEQRLADLESVAERMAPDELLAIMAPICDTLEKAHELGIVHRDIKPANIFILAQGRGVRLLDFGFSRLQSSATLTQGDMVMGSPSYIAPEAWQGGSKAAGRQADLYAAGVIVFRALTGKLPFEGASLVETMRLVTAEERPNMLALRPDLPPQVDQWMRYALAVDPGCRFQSASAFKSALTAVLQGAPLPEHTRPDVGALSPPATTVKERKSAFAAALDRASSLLKRVATSLVPVPRPPESASSPLTPVGPALARRPVPDAPLRPAPPVTSRKPVPARELPPVPVRRVVGLNAPPTVAASRGGNSPNSAALVGGRSGAGGRFPEPTARSAAKPTSIDAELEQDALISDLLTPSDPPRHPAKDVAAVAPDADPAAVVAACDPVSATLEEMLGSEPPTTPDAAVAGALDGDADGAAESGEGTLASALSSADPGEFAAVAGKVAVVAGEVDAVYAAAVRDSVSAGLEGKPTREADDHQTIETNAQSELPREAQLASASPDRTLAAERRRGAAGAAPQNHALPSSALPAQQGVRAAAPDVIDAGIEGGSGEVSEQRASKEQSVVSKGRATSQAATKQRPAANQEAAASREASKKKPVASPATAGAGESNRPAKQAKGTRAAATKQRSPASQGKETSRAASKKKPVSHQARASRAASKKKPASSRATAAVGKAKKKPVSNQATASKEASKKTLVSSRATASAGGSKKKPVANPATASRAVSKKKPAASKGKATSQAATKRRSAADRAAKNKKGASKGATAATAGARAAQAVPSRATPAKPTQAAKRSAVKKPTTAGEAQPKRRQPKPR